VTQELRQDPRIDLLAQVQVSRSSEVHIMETVNISKGGLFVLGDPAIYPDLSVGVEVELLLFLPEADDGLTCLAKVVHVQAAESKKDQPAGFGLNFTKLDDEDRWVLNNLLS
jgi:Tfp pilus assembly protein PilZ